MKLWNYEATGKMSIMTIALAVGISICQLGDSLDGWSKGLPWSHYSESKGRALASLGQDGRRSVKNSVIGHVLEVFYSILNVTPNVNGHFALRMS